MRCINCGVELKDDNSIFCDKCYKNAVAKDTATTETAATVETVRDVPGNNGKKNPKKSKKKRLTRNIIISVSAVVAVIILVPAIWLTTILGKIERGKLSSDLGISEAADKPFDDDVKNIALFGLDTRDNNTAGRSDAIIVLSIDRVNRQIKMTSVARDTYIQFENGKHDKITHAWAYGKANLAVKTLNRNFSLDITDYVTVNFYQFSAIIDYIGGVMIDVDENEMKVMNREYIPYLSDMGIECDPITSPGLQLLNGGQALAYTRDRYTGSDMARGGRQREVLQEMFAQAKKISPLKFPKLVDMVASECTTSLSSGEMLKLGYWAITANPSLKSLGLPNDECNSHTQMINGTSYVIYDLDLASDILHNFIYSKNEEVSSQVPSSVSKKN